MHMNLSEIVSEREINRIHNEAKQVLCDVGIRVRSEEGRLLLESAGAAVDHDSEVVKLTDTIIEACIESAPETVVYGGRTQKHDCKIELGGPSLYAHPPGGPVGFVDYHSGNFRQSTTEDTIQWIALSDALEEIDTCTPVYPSDVQEKIRDIYVTQLLLKNTEKHIHVSPYGEKNMEFIIKSVLRVQEEEELKRRPLVSVVAASLSPLQYSANAFGVLSIAGSYGVPVEMATNPIGGTTSPITMAGVVLLTYAELLGGIVLSQIAHSGAPLIAFPLPSHLNMRTSALQQGKVENAMMTLALIQIIHNKCKIPVNASGLITDSLLPDGQSMLERTLNLVFSAMGGADLVTGAGQIEHYYAVSSAQLVMDNYLLKIARKATEGIKINAETLGLSAVRRQGLTSNFLTDEHTIKYFKDEYLESNISNDITREEWEKQGSKTFYQLAEEEASEIINRHEKHNLPDVTVSELADILEEAEKFDWESVKTALW